MEILHFIAHLFPSSFKNMIPTMTVVLRDGERKSVSVDKLTLGDIVELKGGDKVPADIRVIQTSGMKVDNSSLTGESDPLARTVDLTDENPLETKNLAFYSTNINQGTGKGIVIKIGDDTVIGRFLVRKYAKKTFHFEKPFFSVS